METVEVRTRKDKTWAIVDRLRESFTGATVSVDNVKGVEDVLNLTIKGELTAQQWFTIGLIVQAML
jgi:hypothetical protein